METIFAHSAAGSSPPPRCPSDRRAKRSGEGENSGSHSPSRKGFYHTQKMRLLRGKNNPGRGSRQQMHSHMPAVRPGIYILRRGKRLDGVRSANRSLKPAPPTGGGRRRLWPPTPLSPLLLPRSIARRHTHELILHAPATPPHVSLRGLDHARAVHRSSLAGGDRFTGRPRRLLPLPLARRTLARRPLALHARRTRLIPGRRPLLPARFRPHPERDYQDQGDNRQKAPYQPFLSHSLISLSAIEISPFPEEARKRSRPPEASTPPRPAGG
jgi:hypothetical protein